MNQGLRTYLRLAAALRRQLCYVERLMPMFRSREAEMRPFDKVRRLRRP